VIPDRAVRNDPPNTQRERAAMGGDFFVSPMRRAA